MSFQDEVIKRLQGDDITTVADRVTKKAKSAFTQQVSALNYRAIELDEELSTAKDLYSLALYPAAITDGKTYCQSIANAKAVVDAVENQITTVNESITFFQNLLDTEFPDPATTAAVSELTTGPETPAV